MILLSLIISVYAFLRPYARVLPTNCNCTVKRPGHLSIPISQSKDPVNSSFGCIPVVAVVIVEFLTRLASGWSRKNKNCSSFDYVSTCCCCRLSCCLVFTIYFFFATLCFYTSFFTLETFLYACFLIIFCVSCPSFYVFILFFAVDAR